MYTILSLRLNKKSKKAEIFKMVT